MAMASPASSRAPRWRCSWYARPAIRRCRWWGRRRPNCMPGWTAMWRFVAQPRSKGGRRLFGYITRAAAARSGRPKAWTGHKPEAISGQRSKYSVYGFLGATSLALPAAPATSQGAAVEQLQSGLAAAPSATQFLTSRCAALKLTDPPLIRAVREQSQGPDIPGIRKALQVSAGASGWAIAACCWSARRHLLLPRPATGIVLPSRLTSVPNYLLEYHRHLVRHGGKFRSIFTASQLSSKAVNEPGVVLRVMALLKNPQERPFSFVSENYTSELLADRKP